MYKTLNAWVNWPLRRLGLELRRKDSRDAFSIQSELIKQPAPIIFDVGAAVGGISARYKSLFPGAKIHAFEPFPESFAKLRECFGASPNFKLNQVAISDAEGVIRFNSNRSALTNSMLATDPLGADSWGEGVLETQTSIEVPATTIDLYSKENAIDRIDILKLDIQGGELRALNGAASMLRLGRVTLVYLEIIHTPTYVGQPHFEDYLQFLRGKGYIMLDTYHPVRKGHRLLQCDVIFIRDRPVPADSRVSP